MRNSEILTRKDSVLFMQRRKKVHQLQNATQELSDVQMSFVES